MNKLSPTHKEILNKLASLYSTEEIKQQGMGKYYSKRNLRKILIYFKWNSTDAINAIENDICSYWFVNDD